MIGPSTLANKNKNNKVAIMLATNNTKFSAKFSSAGFRIDPLLIITLA